MVICINFTTAFAAVPRSLSLYVPVLKKFEWYDVLSSVLIRISHGLSFFIYFNFNKIFRRTTRLLLRCNRQEEYTQPEPRRATVLSLENI